MKLPKFTASNVILFGARPLRHRDDGEGKSLALWTQMDTNNGLLTHYLVGGLEQWNFMTFHSVGIIMIPTDELIFFRGVAQPPPSIIVYPSLSPLKWSFRRSYPISRKTQMVVPRNHRTPKSSKSWPWLSESYGDVWGTPILRDLQSMANGVTGDFTKIGNDEWRVGIG